MTEINIREKLRMIQMELKAPKGQTNSFGRYKYRSTEDILEAVKPVAHKYNCAIVVSDEMIQLGDRFYIKSTCALVDTNTDQMLNSFAYARESATKKGMDDSQITGSASSYARKYAMNGLFAIDDTKDADATNTHDKQISKQSMEDII